MLFISSFYIMPNNQLSRGYEILSWNSAFELINDKGLRFEKPTQTLKVENSTKVFVYEISDSETVIMPEYPVPRFSRNSYPAFLFHDKTLVNQVIATMTFPIPDEFITGLEKEKSKIRNISSTYNEYISYFDTMLGSDLANSITIEKLRNVHPKIIKRKNEEYIEKLLIAYSIVVSQYLINTKGAEYYILRVDKGYSPYLIPCVKINGQVINIFQSLDKKTLSITFDNFLDRVFKDADLANIK